MNSTDPFTVTVDAQTCLGSGNCVAAASDVFAFSDEGTAEVVDQGGATLDQVLDAAESCPVSAVVVTDGSGKTLYPLS